MKFESARVCLLRAADSQPQGVTEDVALTQYEVLAWPPGTVDSPLLPQVGDTLTVPGYDQPFRVSDRAFHWPPPSSAEARRGEIQVNLVVRPADPDNPRQFALSPFGRPGEAEIRAEGRWLGARVSGYQGRTTFAGTPYMRIDFAIDGVGTLPRQVTYNWQALEMFPGWADFQNEPRHEAASQGALRHCLRVGQEFEVRVAPSELPSQAGRLEIWEVRPPRQLEPGEEPNTWADNANEITDEAWGGGNL